MSDVLDLEEIRAELGYASGGIDGPDAPYRPHSLAAMRAAEKLLAEVERLTARAEKAEAEVARIRTWLTSIEAVRIVYNHAEWDDVYRGSVNGLAALAAALEAPDAP